MGYISVRDSAERWGISVRRVQVLCEKGRIEGARRFGRSWMIPADAEKPGDPRFKKRPPQNSLSAKLAHTIAALFISVPRDNPYGILDAVSDEKRRLHFEACFAYMRGDFETTKRCFRGTEGDTAVKLCSCGIGIAAAISTGDYAFYQEIETCLESIAKADVSKDVTVFAELQSSVGYLGAMAPDMVPEWLKDGDFTALQPQAMPEAIQQRVKYFQCRKKYESMLEVARTALALTASIQGTSMSDAYLRLLGAVACLALDRADEAKRYLLDAMNICLPHGFITPFAELLPYLGGLMEQCMGRAYPEYRDAVVRQANCTLANWAMFHNHFTKGNITRILSLREIEIAHLAARRVPYTKIAQQLHLSTGSVKNAMQVIYEKTFVNSREELAKIVF